MKKIGIIVQRYGLEVNGGAEYHARLLAEKLNDKYDIKVLTTTSLSYHDWKEHYPVGNTTINNIKVQRFFTHTKNRKNCRKARRNLMPKRNKLLNTIGITKKSNLYRTVTKEDGDNWINAQGPYCPDLIKYLKEKSNDYSVFIFFTYLYYPSHAGLQIVGDKSIFIPTAHDEPELYTKAYDKMFSWPKFIMYNSESEKKLSERIFRNMCPNTDIAGVGISEPPQFQNNQKNDVEIEKPYFIYIGRIDVKKGCVELINAFKKISKLLNVKLVLIGKSEIKIKASDTIIPMGFVPESLKYRLLKGARALIMPSKFESLSMVTLEAMQQGIPVIVNKRCDVLKAHIEKSKAGFYYDNNQELDAILQKMITMSNNEYTALQLNGIEYVKENYNWETIIQKFDKAIEFIIHANKTNEDH